MISHPRSAWGWVAMAPGCPGRAILSSWRIPYSTSSNIRPRRVSYMPDGPKSFSTNCTHILHSWSTFQYAKSFVHCANPEAKIFRPLCKRRSRGLPSARKISHTKHTSCKITPVCCLSRKPCDCCCEWPRVLCNSRDLTEGCVVSSKQACCWQEGRCEGQGGGSRDYFGWRSQGKIHSEFPCLCICTVVSR